jgi:hypothetical protein
MFFLDEGATITDLLKECTSFVFYITDPQLTFLLAYNDHGYLIVCGEAKEWLRNYSTVKELGLEIYEHDALEAN